MRELIALIPDGHYTVDGALDSDGVTDESVPFTVQSDVTGSSVAVDFTEAPPQRRGPVNAPLATTVSIARFAFVSLLGGDTSVNEGHFRPIEIRTRPGSLFHAVPPAPIYLYAWPGVHALDRIHQSLADVLPDRVRAGSGGDLCGIICWGWSSNRGFWSASADHVVGQGATREADGGAPLIHISCSGERNTPIEIWEERYPFLVEQYELAADSGGGGCRRGGLGVDISYRALEDCEFTIILERTKSPGWGLEAGLPGRPNRCLVHYPDGSMETVAKRTGLAVPRGTVIEIQTGGGGGWGSPADRQPEALERDRTAHR